MFEWMCDGFKHAPVINIIVHGELEFTMALCKMTVLMWLSQDNSDILLVFPFLVFSKHQTKLNLYKASYEVGTGVTLILYGRKRKGRMIRSISARSRGQCVTELRFDPRTAWLQAWRAQIIKALYLWRFWQSLKMARGHDFQYSMSMILIWESKQY